ncbi:MAG: hypothetical protein M9958_05900 [Chitinophagales bacterium]|nr:hypothetical protein [Chitinophagales bacterium]
MKSLFIIMLSLFTFCIELMGQTSYEDVVYLKNGSVIHGIIVEQIPNESIKIKSGNNVFVFKLSEVQKMTKEEIISSSNQGNRTNVQYDENELKTYLVKKLQTESKSNLQFVEFQKTNGASKIINGQDYYEIWFTFSFKPVKPVYKDGNSWLVSSTQGGVWRNFEVATQKAGGYDAFLSVDGQNEYASNRVIKLSGKAELKKTEQTWLITQLSFSKEELVADVSGVARHLNINGNIQEGENYFLIKDVPLTGSGYTMYQPVQINVPGTIADLAKNIVYKSLSGFRRGQKVSADEYNAATGEKWIVTMTIEKASNSLKSGKALIGGKPYSGYQCEIEMVWKMSKVGDPSTSFTERTTVNTGTPMDNKTEEKAMQSALSKFEDEVKETLLKYGSFQANVLEINELDKKGLPREITLDNAQYLSYGKTIYFFITKEKDLYVGYKNAISMRSVVATGVYRTTISGKIVCKILSGEQNLSRELATGEKLIAISTISRPTKVD